MQPGRSASRSVIRRLARWPWLALALICLARVSSAQNVVVVIVDDVGAEWFEAYAEQAGNPPTPTIQALADEGVLFRNAWAYPVCSPFRISVYTGQHPTQHGAGHAIDGNDDAKDFVLDPSTPNLGRLLSEAGFRTAAVGKWHMAIELGFNGLTDQIISITEAHPNATGMEHFSGFLFGGLLYFDWWKTVDGVSERVSHYATTDTADAAIAQLSGSEPFFLWVGFNAPHAVFHDPPPELLADPSIYANNGAGQYRAMIEAMDTELGRILEHVDLTDTTVIFVSDNGTLGGFLQPPRAMTQGKASVYETGVRVPLIVAGQAVAESRAGSQSLALVQATDLFPTILEMAGLTPPYRPDANSFLPCLANPGTCHVRETSYTEIFTPNGGPIDPQSHDRAARGPRYKLVRRASHPDELYDLMLDPYELSPLSNLTLTQYAAYAALHEAILERAAAGPVPALRPGLLLALAVALAVAARMAVRRRVESASVRRRSV